MSEAQVAISSRVHRGGAADDDPSSFAADLGRVAEPNQMLRDWRDGVRGARMEVVAATQQCKLEAERRQQAGKKIKGSPGRVVGRVAVAAAGRRS